MLKNYLKTALRTLSKHKVFGFINITGLTVGLAACMLVLTVVLDDLSYDCFWKRSDDLYRVYAVNKLGDGIYTNEAYTPIGLGTELKERFPEVEDFAKVFVHDLQLKPEKGSPNGINVHVISADSSAVHLFDFQKVSGQLGHYVAGQDNILITESLAKRLFKTADPIGKIIYDTPTWKDKPTPYLITAVIKDIPQNTHLRAEAVILQEPKVEHLEKNQGTTNATIYYLLKEGINKKFFEKKVNSWYSKHLDIEAGKVKFVFQPLRDIYLHSDFNTRQEIKSNVRTVYIFGSVGVFLLLIACINFINLSTARALHRLKESGIRKILGADRKQLIGQFLTESLLFFFISMGFAFLLYTLSLPLLEKFLDHGLTETIFAHWSTFGLTLLFILLLSLFTGGYPAIQLSGFNPSNSLRGRFSSSITGSSNFFRKALVVVQFTIAVVTLIALFVARSQLYFLNQKDLGFSKENLLYVDRISWEGKGEAMKTQLKQLSGVIDVSIAGWQPQDGAGSGSMTFDHPLKQDEQTEVNVIFGDLDFPKTIGIRLTSGRLFDRSFGSDTPQKTKAGKEQEEEKETQEKPLRPVIISAYTAKDYGIRKEGQEIGSSGHKAIGVIQDFYYESLHHSLKPLFLEVEDNFDYGGMFIRVVPGQEQQVLSDLHNLWKSFYPDKLLSTTWMDEIVQKQYEKEQKQQALFTFFSTLMLFISSLGIFGLVLHAAEQRVKEIGIRKVLGATVVSIVSLLSKDFVKLVFLALIIASPIAWWAMSKWLEDFAYHIDIQWWMFALAGCTAIITALLTVSIKAFKAARANPVESLRNE